MVVYFCLIGLQTPVNISKLKHIFVQTASFQDDTERQLFSIIEKQLTGESDCQI